MSHPFGQHAPRQCFDEHAIETLARLPEMLFGGAERAQDRRSLRTPQQSGESQRIYRTIGMLAPDDPKRDRAAGALLG
jgi:hypothetical protein